MEHVRPTLGSILEGLAITNRDLKKLGDIAHEGTAKVYFPTAGVFTMEKFYLAT